MDKILEFLKRAFDTRPTWKGRLGQILYMPFLIIGIAIVIVSLWTVALSVVVIDTVCAPLTCVVAYVSGWKYRPMIFCLDSRDDRLPGFERLIKE